MKKVLFALAAFFVLAAWTTNKKMANGGKKFILTLTGAQEVNGAGDPDATGTAVLIFNQGQGTLTYELTVSGIDGTISGAHIHRAPAGVAGPIVIHLIAPVSGSSSGVVSVPKDLIKDIRQNPEDYYINVHSLPNYGPGAIRAQLSNN